MRGLLCLAVLTSACHVTASDGISVVGVDSGHGADGPVQLTGDASPDSFVLGAFGTPTPLAPGNTNAAEDDGTLAWNGNELIFARVDGQTKHLYYASRPDAGSPFGTATLLSHSTDSTHQDETPRFAADDLTLYFGSNRSPNSGGTDIWKMTRATIGGAWNLPTKITALSTGNTEKWVSPCSTGYFLMVRSDATSSDVYGGLNLASPTKIVELSTNASETGTYLSQDCLTAYFASTRDGTNDLWMSTRPAIDAAWGAPTKFTFSTDTNNEQDPWMSMDQRTFVFASDVTGAGDIYISTR
jgi:hypothetical protein